MKIIDLKIRNFKSVKDIHIQEIENALILVGQNNTGKTAILDAVRAMEGSYVIQDEDFQEDYPNIEIGVSLLIEKEDLLYFHQCGLVSQYKRYESWHRDFCEKLPSYQGNVLTFEYIVNKEGKSRYSDGVQKHNPFIRQVLPKIYYFDTHINL